MAVKLSALLAELPETTRNSTTGALDNTKRTRGINRILQKLQSYADWKFTKRTKEFDFIDGIHEYSLQNYVGTTCLDNDSSTEISDFKSPFDVRLSSGSHKPFSFRDEKDVRDSIRNGKVSVNEYGIDGDLLILNYPRQTSSQLSNTDSTTGWNVSGDATNLTADTVEFKEGSGSLNFDVSAGTSLVITNTSLSSKDLTTLQNKSYLVVWVYLPTITNFTSIKADWGSDVTSNYWTKTETARADGQDLEVGWNLFAFKWADATETGSPDVTAVDSVQFTITYSSATTDTDFRIDDVRIAKATKMKLEYFSEAMTKTSSGDYQLEFNADSVTQTDELLGSESRIAVVTGATYELFKMIGGKSERDRTDSYNEYKEERKQLYKKSGHRLRREGRVLNFPTR